MRTIRRSGEFELEIKRSRFLCALSRADSEEQAREFVALRRKLHHDARHHCSAYVLDADGRTQRSNDDGEPAGTAGVPMLEVLRHNELTRVVAVVTRYFGGTLLGAGGLVRAYGGAVSAALEQVGLAELRPMRLVSTTVDYLVAGKLENDLRSHGFSVSDVDYSDRVRFVVEVPADDVEDFRHWLAEATGGAAEPLLGEVVHAEVPVPRP
ncbi:YigZ family protein [Saccharopolyspora sp. 6M]|uniref:YigZ family protein n=1 Tax=Saccharopolyspora sp. 6M TaxID=2877237 RepID=UPI001CD2AAE5|nr:YigZ family protein [Saccharopolyspora sp. 6M]MCA1227134.1 YigZ family protein [Saccharopolyspora sp. 6M]